MLQEKPEASGERFVLSQAALWMNDLSQAAFPVFKPLGYHPPYYNMPTPVLRILSWVMPRYATPRAKMCMQRCVVVLLPMAVCSSVWSIPLQKRGVGWLPKLAEIAGKGTRVRKECRAFRFKLAVLLLL